MEAALFVPAHAAATDDICALAQYNIDKVHAIAARILDLCAEPLNMERILQQLFSDYQLTMTFEQYALVGSTVRNYLVWLKESGRLNAFFDNNLLLWQRV